MVGMAVTKLSSREFNQDTSRAKRAAERGPVFITDRGRPISCLAHSRGIREDYRWPEEHCGTYLTMTEAAEIEFEPRRLTGISTSSRICADVHPRHDP